MPARGTPNPGDLVMPDCNEVSPKPSLKDNRNRHIPHGLHFVQRVAHPLKLPPLVYQNINPQCLFDLYASAMNSCLPKRLDAKSVASSASNPRKHQKHGYSPVAPALTNGANADELLQMKMQINRRDKK